MKSFILILLIAFITQTFTKGFIVAHYYSNTKQYASQCINKAKPSLHCNGKCQMLKKMKQTGGNTDQNQEKKSELKTDLLYLNSENLLSVLKFISVSNRFSVYQNKHCTDFYSTIFHPPGLYC